MPILILKRLLKSKRVLNDQKSQIIQPLLSFTASLHSQGIRHPFILITYRVDNVQGFLHVTIPLLNFELLGRRRIHILILVRIVWTINHLLVVIDGFREATALTLRVLIPRLGLLEDCWRAIFICLLSLNIESTLLILLCEYWFVEILEELRLLLLNQHVNVWRGVFTYCMKWHHFVLELIDELFKVLVDSIHCLYIFVILKNWIL